MANPLVSIIIPAYNSEKFISQCLESAINQTYKNIEIIVIDDGSTDQSLAILKRFEYDNLKIFSQANKGASAARNFGLSIAKGEFIQFLDADDFISFNKIENQINLAIVNSNKLIVCSTIHFLNGENYIDKKPSNYEDSFIFNTDNSTEFLINLWGGNTGFGSMIQPNAWLTPKDIIDKAGLWNEELSLNDDGEFFARVILNSEGVIYSPNTANYYRKYKYDDNLSGHQSLKAYTSLLMSIILCKKELLARTNARSAKFAIYRLLCEVAIESYPKYKCISKRAYRELPTINHERYKKDFGSYLSNTIAKIFGWKFLKLLQHLKTNLKQQILT